MTCEQNLATPSWALQILNAELILSSAEVSQLLEAGLPETAASGAHNFTQPETMEALGPRCQSRSTYAMAFLSSDPILPKLIAIVSLQNIPTQDRLEGMAAFREKRPPKFVGK